MSEDGRVTITVDWHKIGDRQSAKIQLVGERKGLHALVQKLVDLVMANSR